MKALKFLGCIALLFAAFVACTIRSEEAHVYYETNLVIDKPFFWVRGILADPSVTVKLIESDNTKILKKEQLNQNFEILRKPLRWHYKSRDLVTLKSETEYGESVNDFEHWVSVNPNTIGAVFKLAKPSRDLAQYEFDVLYQGQNDKTEVKLRLEMKVIRVMPYWLGDYFRDKVDEFAFKSLQNSKTSIQKIFESKGWKVY